MIICVKTFKHLKSFHPEQLECWLNTYSHDKIIFLSKHGALLTLFYLPELIADVFMSSHCPLHVWRRAWVDQLFLHILLYLSARGLSWLNLSQLKETSRLFTKYIYHYKLHLIFPVLESYQYVDVNCNSLYKRLKWMIHLNSLFQT